MADLNQSIRSIEHEVAVDVINTIVTNANEYADTIAKEESEIKLLTNVRDGKKVNKADVEKLLPTSGTLGIGGNVGNLDLLEVLFLESIFSQNKVNAENVKTIGEIIKTNDVTKKSIQDNLLEYFLAPLESVWAADQYQNEKFDKLSDAANKVFGIIYKDFLSTPESIKAIDFTPTNFEKKEIKKDAFNLIIKRCIDLGVNAKTIKDLVNKGISVIESDKELLLDLHSYVKFAYYKAVNEKFKDLDGKAKDDADYSEMSKEAIEGVKELGEAIKSIEDKSAKIGLEIEGSIEEFINLANERAAAYFNAASGISSSEAPAKPKAPEAAEEPETPATAKTETPAPAKTETPAAEEPETPAPAKPKAPAAEEPKAPAPAKPQISEEFISNVIVEAKKYEGESEELFGDLQVKNILKDLSGRVLSKEEVTKDIKKLMSFNSGSLGERFKPVGEYQDVVKNALYTCANYQKSNKYHNNCFAGLKEGKLTESVKKEAKDNVCYYKVSENGSGQYVNLDIKFTEKGYPEYSATKTANPKNDCSEIKNNDPLELLAIAEELTTEI